MRARFALVAFAAVFTLAGCDLFGGTDDSISGYWEGTAVYSVDTVLVDQNVRIKADYEFLFTFDLEQDDGLVTGRIRALREGDTVYREAGFSADTIRYTGGVITNEDDAYGTFVQPELELDVPDGPYSADLWTFDVVGSRAESESFIDHERQFVRRLDGESFTLTLRSMEPFTMYRKDRPADQAETAQSQTLSSRDSFRIIDASRLQRSEQ